MTADRPTPSRSTALLAVVLVAVVAVLTLTASPAVAQVGPAAGARVAASDHDPGPGVGAEQSIPAGGGRGTTTPQPGTPVGFRVAPQTGDGEDGCGQVTLYRAVEPPELEQIIGDGYVYGVVEGWSEGKYFFPTSQQAADFARMNPDREYTLTSAEFPQSVFSGPEVWVDTIGGEGEAIFLPDKYFPHGTVRVHASIP